MSEDQSSSPGDPATQPTAVNKRSETHYPAAQESEEAKAAHRPYWGLFTSFQFGDIFSALQHTNDFKDRRAEYITTRLRFMAFFFALAVPLYIPVDYFTLTREHFVPIVIVRCILSLIHVFVCWLTFRKLSINQVNSLVGLDMLAAALFYVATIYILHSGVGEVPNIGYTFMPFMIIVMLGLFPLTLISSFLIMMLVVVVPYLGLQVWLDRVVSQETFNMLFLFLLFMGIVLWLQSGQLLMLLKLYRESTRDALTGLINRRVLMKFLDEEVNQHRDKGRCFSILMLDLDRFKLINDNYGHITGDLVLKATARLLENELRLGDIVARFGGEEFVAVLPGLESFEAVAVAERIRKACTNTYISAADGSEVTFSTSIGVAEYRDGENIETTLRRADDALYDAKEQGRNRVVYNTARASEEGPGVSD